MRNLEMTTSDAVLAFVKRARASAEAAQSCIVQGWLKRMDSRYVPDDRGLWRKAKCLNREEFVEDALVQCNPLGDVHDRKSSIATLAKRPWKVEAVEESRNDS
jgi:hypothetical protein